MADEITTTTTETSTAQTPVQPLKPVTSPDDAPILSQKQFDEVLGRRLKESAGAERKRLLKELGIEDADDPKAVEAIKGKLTAAQQAEDERLSDIDKANKRAEQAEKKAAEAEAKALAAEAKRRADYVDGRIQNLASDAKAIDAAEVADHFRSKRAEEIDALYGEDGKFNETAAKKLIEDIKKSKAHWFKAASGVSSPSVSGGRALEPESTDRKRAEAHSQRTIRG